MTTRETRTAFIKSLFARPHLVSAYDLGQLAQIVLTQDKECIPLLAALFELPTMSEAEKEELADYLNALLKAYDPDSDQQVSVDEIPAALIVLLSHSSGIPETFLTSFLSWLHLAPELGFLVKLEVHAADAVKEYWASLSDRSPATPRSSSAQTPLDAATR